MIKRLPSGKYQIDYRTPSGKRIRKSFDTRGEAMRKLAEQTLDPKEPKRHRSLRDMLEFHVSRAMLHWQPRSRSAWRARAEPFVAWAEARDIRYANQVTVEIALEYAAFCASTRKGKGIELRLTAASTLFRTELTLRDTPAVHRNPFAAIRKSGYTRKRQPRLVLLEEVRAFFDCCSEFERHLFQLKYAGGLRTGEVRNLEWKQITEKGIWIGSDDFTPKTDESTNLVRWNQILLDSIAWFRQRTAGKKYVVDFDTFAEHIGIKVKNGRIGQNFIWRRFNDICDIAAKKYPEFEWSTLTPHKFRNAFLSHMAGAGLSTSKLQQLARHRSYKTTEQYVRIADTTLDQDARTLDTIWGRNGHFTPTPSLELPPTP